MTETAGNPDSYTRVEYQYSPATEDTSMLPMIAGAKLTRGMSFLDREHTVCVESGSVYGAAMLMPQLARTAGWTRELTSRMVASYLMLLLCIFLHLELLKFISKEEKIMDGFGGQMYLCDFGANIYGCKGDECLGPGGTKMTAPRLYSWNAWALRGFVRDTLTSLFPNMEDQIDMVADPGEYGLESYTCRLLCVVIFIISIMPEMQLCIDMTRLAFLIPSRNEPWLELVENGNEKDDADTCSEKVKVKVAGMSYFWKAVNFFVVLVPKAILLYMTANAGLTFLMETAGMDDIIVNSVAMGFLLSLDELIVDAFLAKSTDNLTEQCEPFDYVERADAERLDNDETMHLFGDKQKTDSAQGFCQLLAEIFFKRLVKFFVTVLLLAFFLGKYYLDHCEYKGGQWVSKPASAPLSLKFDIANMFTIFPVPKEESPYWTMPEPSD
mmetsp:Transcript_1470/g.2731  ORF Transcript_1470/g.2731 Transcript_1470/m.2731 type:complete len:440 (-) Transcript_1470:112-1431(-)